MANSYAECAITTFDNPFDPFEEFTQWNLFDKEKGYDSNYKVARLVNFTDEMSDREKLIENERAIDRLIALDVTNTYKKVTRIIN